MVGVVLLPDVAAAQLVRCEGPDCDFCTIVESANYLINWLIGILIVLAVFLIALAGFKLVTSGGNSGALDEAKKMLSNALIGFIIVLAAWLIVDTIMKGLLPNQGQILGRPWNTITCQPQPELFETSFDELVDNQIDVCDPNTPVGTCGDIPRGSDGLPAATVSRMLTGFGIEVKSGAGLDGVQPHVIREVVKLDEACDCNLLITEGTAGQHASGAYSHANGYKLDIRTNDNPQLINYVKDNFTFGGNWSNGTPYYVSGKTTCAIEATHLDCQFRP